MMDGCNDPRSTGYLHVCIDTPNGRWIQGDFLTEHELWVWVAAHFVTLREKYGQHEWFKVRIEKFTL